MTDRSAASSCLPGVSRFADLINGNTGQSALAVRRPEATSPAMNSANSSIVLACRPWCASNNSNMREACTKGSLSAPLRVMAETVFFVIAASPTRAPLARARGLRREGCLVVKQPPEVHCCWIERRAVAGLAVITRRLRGCNPHAHAKMVVVVVITLPSI